MPKTMYAKDFERTAPPKGFGRKFAKSISKVVSPVRALKAPPKPTATILSAPEGTRTNQYWTCAERFLPRAGLIEGQVDFLFLGGKCPAGSGWTKVTSKPKDSPFQSQQIWKCNCFPSGGKKACKFKIGHFPEADMPEKRLGDRILFKIQVINNHLMYTHKGGAALTVASQEDIDAAFAAAGFGIAHIQPKPAAQLKDDADYDVADID